MKPVIAIFFTIIALMLASCGGKTSASLSATSSNQKVKVSISGSRSNTVDPFKVILTVKAYDFKDGRLEFEIYADDLNDQNVKFNWQDDRNCLITFKQQDGVERKFQVIADDTQVQVAEVNPQ
jgi:hypothetical protein